MDELAVQSVAHLRVIQDNLGDERPGLKVTTPLALEQVALGADHRALREHLRQIRHVILPARRARRQAAFASQTQRWHLTPEYAGYARRLQWHRRVTRSLRGGPHR